MDYDADDTTFTGFIYRIKIPEFKKLTDQVMEKQRILNKILLNLIVENAISLQMVIAL